MKLSAYRQAAPFKIGELLAALDGLLGAGVISIRTLRFYGARGIMPRPLGAPKFARYGYEHLLSVLAAKMLQDRGAKLDRIAQQIAPIHEGHFDPFEAQVEEWLGGNTVRESLSVYAQAPPTMRRIALTPLCAIEVEPEADLRSALQEAMTALEALIASLG